MGYVATGGRRPRTLDVPLSGGQDPITVTVRGLRGDEVAAIVDAIDRPRPPMIPDPARGSLSLHVANTNDPGYLDAMRVYGRKYAAAEVAVAIDLVLNDGPLPGDAGKRKDWIIRAIDQVRREFIDSEIDALWNALHALTGIDAVKDMIRTLIVQVPAPKKGEKDTLEIPEHWARTEDGLLFRAASRFGQDPITWPLSLSADDRLRVIADQVLWQREEDTRLTILAGIRSAIG